MTKLHPIVPIALLALICGSTRPVEAGPITIQVVVATGSYEIDVNGNRDTLTGAQLTAGTVPAGAGFTLSKNKKGDVVVTSTVAGKEPTVERTVASGGDPNPTIFGQSPDFPGEQGFARLTFTGLNGTNFSAGSTVEAGVQGGFSASYTTVAGDTYQQAFDDLLPLLDANGVNAFQSGTSLFILSSITDESTGAGAVSFTSTDANISFSVLAGTVVPEPSTVIGLGTGAFVLAVGLWRRRIRTSA